MQYCEWAVGGYVSIVGMLYGYVFCCDGAMNWGMGLSMVRAYGLATYGSHDFTRCFHPNGLQCELLWQS